MVPEAPATRDEYTASKEEMTEGPRPSASIFVRKASKSPMLAAGNVRSAVRTSRLRDQRTTA
eukprot:scaffold803_cov310-Pinguiococcus_pyrenoidosus.AAC.34